jgi:hypothetical protein
MILKINIGQGAIARRILSDAPDRVRIPSTLNVDARKVAVSALEQFASILLRRPHR